MIDLHVLGSLPVEDVKISNNHARLALSRVICTVPL